MASVAFPLLAWRCLSAAPWGAFAAAHLLLHFPRFFEVQSFCLNLEVGYFLPHLFSRFSSRSSFSSRISLFSSASIGISTIDIYLNKIFHLFTTHHRLTKLKKKILAPKEHLARVCQSARNRRKSTVQPEQ